LFIFYFLNTVIFPCLVHISNPLLLKSRLLRESSNTLCFMYPEAKQRSKQDVICQNYKLILIFSRLYLRISKITFLLALLTSKSTCYLMIFTLPVCLFVFPHISFCCMAHFINTFLAQLTNRSESLKRIKVAFYWIQ
jgi:hypothetical protein